MKLVLISALVLGSILLIVTGDEVEEKQAEEKQAEEKHPDLGLAEPWRMTDENFNQIMKNNSHFIVVAYVNWCGHCKNFAPIWSKVADKINNSPEFKTKAYSANIEDNKLIHNEWDLTSFPTTVYVRNGQRKVFAHDHKEQAVLDFVTKLEADPTVEITADTVEDFVSVSEVSVVGTFHSHDDVEKLNKLAWEMSLPAAAVVVDQNLTPGVTVYSSLEGRPRSVTRRDLSDWDKMKKFISLKRRPLVLPFNRDTQTIPFELKSVTTSVLLFHDDSKEGYEQRMDIMRNIGRSYGRSHNIVEMNMANEHVRRFSGFFKLKSSDMPIVFVIDTDKDSKHQGKMSMTKDITEEGIAQLIEDYRAGSSVEVAPQDQTGEDNEPDELPDDWETRDVKYLTKDNYENYVLNKEADVFVMIYRDSCPHCQKLKPTWSELAKKYNELGTVKIAQMRSKNAQDIEGLKIEYVPTLMLYPKSTQAISEGIKYAEKTIELPDLEKFLLENTDMLVSASKDEL